jgi:KipI family sensor histidine kinase inhibitor
MPERAARSPRVDRVGDAALLVTLGDALDLATSARALRVAAALEARRPRVPGLETIVPGHAGVLVTFDPDTCPEDALRAIVESAVSGAARGPIRAGAGALHEIPVAYGGEDGPDLAEVAARTGLAEAEVVRLHAGTEHRVLVLGFVPGFPYLGVLPPELELPRRATPRVRVPAGSVAIAGRQTGIYPADTPGGWHLIGRTGATLWDPRREPPALLAPGDRVRFVPV